MNPSSPSVRSAPTVVCRTDSDDCDELDEALSRSWLRIGIAAVFAGQGMVFSLALNMTPPDFGSTPYWVLHGGLMFSALIVIAFLGGPLFRSTWGMLVLRRLSIEGLFTLSLLGALIGSMVSSFTGSGSVYYEVVSIVIAIYTCGRMLSERSQTKLRLETDKLRETYDQAERIELDGSLRSCFVSELKLGDRVRVDPGQPICVDGRVLEGVGFVRETALTGEPMPVVRRPEDPVCAGTWSVDGSFEIEVTVSPGQRELDQILQTVEDGAGEASELQVQANRIIQFFLPTVAAVSLLTALYWLWAGTWVEAVLNSMAVLLVACPCALGLATPVAIWNGLFQLSRLGLVSRDGALIDTLARTSHLYLDKTGTLSEATMVVSERMLFPDWLGARSEVLALVHALESRLSHPIARALIQNLDLESNSVEMTDLQIIPGSGVMARGRVNPSAEWRTVQIGENIEALLDQGLVDALQHLKDQSGKRIFVMIDDAVAAVFVLQERLRAGAATVWERCEGLEVAITVLTGDPHPQISVPETVVMRAGLSAHAKARILEASTQAGEIPLFVGDGINDTAAMSHAAASISMGSGTPLAQSTANGHLIRDQIEIIPEAITLSRAIYRRLKGNLYYATVYNLLGMCFAAVGWLHPVLAAAIMLISSFWVTARAMQSEQRHPLTESIR